MRNDSQQQTDMGARPLLGWWPCGLLVAFVFVFFWDSFLAGMAPVMRDTFGDFLPWRTFAREAFRAGVLPLWNPYSNCGQPFMAEPQSAFFYPPHLLYYVLSVVTALKIWLALHLAIAAVSMYALARHWKLGVAPSLVAAVGFAFGTHVVSAMEFQSMLGPIVWSPLALLFTSRLIEDWERSKGLGARAVAGAMVFDVLILALIIATQYLAGHQQALFHSILIDGVYLGVVCASRRDLKGLVVCGVAFGVAGALALGLSMTQFLLTWELVPQSVRAKDLDPQIDFTSLHPRLLLCWLMPFLAGRPGQWWGDNGLSMMEFWLGTCYVGMAPLVLATFALVRPRNGRRALAAFLIAIVAIGVVLAMGKYTPLYMWCFRHLPFVDKFRWPSKFLQLAAFGLPLLGALGLQGLMEEGGRFERRARAAILGAWVVLWLAMLVAWMMWRNAPGFYAALTGGAYVYNPRHPEYLASLSQDLGRSVLFLGLTLAGIVFLLTRTTLRWRRGMAIGLVLLTFVNLLIGREIFPILTDFIYRAEPSGVVRFKDDANPSRCFLNYANNQFFLPGVTDPRIIAILKKSGTGDTWLAEHVFRVYGGGVIPYADYIHLVQKQLWERPLSDPSWQRLATLLNVRHVIDAPYLPDAIEGRVSTEVKVSENAVAIPRAMVVYGWSVERSMEEIRKRLMEPDFDIYRSILVSEVPAGWPANQSVPENSTHEPITRIADAGVESIRYGWNRVDLVARSNGRALLFLDDVYADGWRATVDGREVPIVRANHLFRAVPLESAGVHRVSFEYRPKQVTIGLVVSAVTALIMVAIAFFGWTLKRRKKIRN